MEGAIETKSGYKKTKIGWIPDDWTYKTFKDICKINQGLQIPISKRLTEPIDGAYFYITNEFLKADSEKRYFITNPPKSVICDENDLLMTRTGNTGMLVRNVKGVFHNNFFKIDLKNGINRDYAFYYLSSDKLQKLIMVLAGISTIPDLNHGDFYRIPFPLPPLPEQQKIAQILSTWDKAIEQSQKLIEQLKNRKKGLMQQLLTGKTRLKGFSGEWKEVRLEKVTTKFSRRNKDLIDADVYSVTNTNGFILQSDHFDRKVAGDNLSSHKIIKKGEFAYNPARINVGSIAYFNNEVGVISSLYVCFRTNEKVEDTFFRYWLQLDKTTSDINRFGEGGVRIYLWYELFAKIQIKLPTIKEQQAIINILITADNEIKTQKSYLAQLQAQKKGLMQQLLTGQKRVTIL